MSMKNSIKNISGAKLYFIFLHIVIVIFGIEIVILAKQNREMKDHAQSPSMEQVKIGDRLSFDSLILHTEESYPFNNGKSKILFLFSTTCPFCKENLGKWNNLYSTSKNPNIDILGISLDSKERTEKLILDSSIVFPVLVSPQIKWFSQKNKITGVPITLLVNDSGMVLKLWNGTLEDRALKEVAMAISGKK
jgi:peroxiredoxin